MSVVSTFFCVTELLNSCAVQQQLDKTRLQNVSSIILPKTSLSDLSSHMAEWHFWISSQASLCPHWESFKQPPCSPGVLPISKVNWCGGHCGTVWQELWFLGFQYSWSEVFQDGHWKMAVLWKIYCACGTFGLGISLSSRSIPLFFSALLDYAIMEQGGSKASRKPPSTGMKTFWK